MPILEIRKLRFRYVQSSPELTEPRRASLLRGETPKQEKAAREASKGSVSSLSSGGLTERSTCVAHHSRLVNGS